MSQIQDQHFDIAVFIDAQIAELCDAFELLQIAQMDPASDFDRMGFATNRILRVIEELSQLGIHAKTKIKRLRL